MTLSWILEFTALVNGSLLHVGAPAGGDGTPLASWLALPVSFSASVASAWLMRGATDGLHHRRRALLWPGSVRMPVVVMTTGACAGFACRGLLLHLLGYRA